MLNLSSYINILSNPVSGNDPLSIVLEKMCDDLEFVYGLIFKYQGKYRSLSVEAAAGYNTQDLDKFCHLDIDIAEEIVGKSRSLAVNAFTSNQVCKGSSMHPDYVSFSDEVIDTFSIPFSKGVVTFENSKERSKLDQLIIDFSTLSQIQNMITISLAHRCYILPDFDQFVIENIEPSESPVLPKCLTWLHDKLNIDTMVAYLINRNDLILEYAVTKGNDDTGSFFSQINIQKDNFLGWIARNKQPLRLFAPIRANSKEYEWYGKISGNSPEWKSFSTRNNLKELVGIPLLDGKRVIGVLVAFNLFDSSNVCLNSLIDQSLAEAIGHSLSTIIVRRQRRKVIVDAFIESWSIRANLTLDTLVNRSLEAIIHNTHASEAFLLLRIGVDNSEMRVYTSNLLSQVLTIDNITESESIAGKVLTDQKTINQNNTNIPLFPGSSVSSNPSVLAIPILYNITDKKFESVGVLIAISGNPDAFSFDDEIFLTALAEKVLDTFLVVQYDKDLAEYKAKVELFKHASRSGSLAAGRIHDIRKLLDKTWPEFKKNFEESGLKNDKKFNKQFKTFSQEIEKLVDVFDRLQVFFQTGNIERRKTDIKQLILQTVKEMLNTVQHWNAKISTELSTLPKYINIDNLAIKNVLINIITNSLEAGARSITIRASKVSNDGLEDIEVSIIDNGIGIPPEDFVQIFEPWYSIRKPNNKGSGLGLWMASEILEEHGGRIWLEDSKPNERTVIKFTLPSEDLT